MSRKFRNCARNFFPVVAFLASTVAAHANLVNNASFELTSNGPGQFDNMTIATDWTSTNTNNDAYNFIFASGTADTTGSPGQYGTVELWGPGNGSNNGLPASSPDGGNFVAADGAFQVGAISQTINGLIVGQHYELGFWWGGAQQSGFSGATTEQWRVSLGSQTQSTAVVDDPSHGFTGWMYQTFNFTATSTSELLSFLAVGTPTGEPPFVLLDGVSLNEAPEPGSLPLMFGGLLLIALAYSGLNWLRR